MTIDTGALSVIVPAHNEERRIRKALIDLRAALPSAEIIVVVNNCTDRTVDVVRTITETDSAIRLVVVPAQVGKGGAVRIGFLLASHPLVAFVDADGATSGKELRRLCGYLDVAECVVASRWLSGARIQVKQSALRRFLGRGFNLCVRVLFGLRISDTQCGAKLFRGSVLQQILDEVETADFAFDIDVLYAIHRRHLRIREVPTVWTECAGSSVNVLVAVPRMFLSIIRLRIRHSFFRFVLPLFDRSFRVSTIRSRRTLRYLVIAPHARGSSRVTQLERDVSTSLESFARRGEIEWFSLDTVRWLLPLPGWVRAMVVYLGRFRDEFDGILEVLPDGRPYMTPFYSLKPKVVVAPEGVKLPPAYSSALIVEGDVALTRLDETLTLATARTGTHIMVDRDGQLVLSQSRSNDAFGGLILPRNESSGEAAATEVH